MYKYLLPLIMFSSLSQADSFNSREHRVLAGQVDSFDSHQLVLSDRVFVVSKLVNCFDRESKRLATCSYIKKGDYIKISIPRVNDAQVMAMQVIPSQEVGLYGRR